MKRILSIIGLALASAAAVAQQGYAFRKVDIRAAYLHLSGDHVATGVGQSLTAPFVWFNLDSNLALKPAGWNIYNPLAPGWLDPSEVAFFSARYANTPTGRSAVNKRTVRYWWQNVSEMADDDFAQLDVALLQVTTPNLAVSPSDREKLRRFVDKGGVLWIDYTYGSLDQTQGGPVSYRVYTPAQPLIGAQADYKSTLLRYPMAIASGEVGVLAAGPAYAGMPLSNMAPSDLTLESAGAIAPLLSSAIGVSGEYSLFKTVAGIGVGTPPSVSFAKIGDGYVVATTRGLSEGLNRIGNNLNREFYAADPAGQTGQTSRAGVVATAISKFVINAISLTTQSTQTGSGSRKNYSSFIDTGSPLLQLWAAPYSTPTGVTSPYSTTTNQFRPPVIYKGMSFSVADDRVFVHDANPKNDADRDGNVDDGVQDFFMGNEEDFIFSTAPVGGGISSAVCVEVPSPAAGVPTDQLLVTTSDGRLLVYPIFDPVTRRCPASEVVPPIAALSPGLGGTASLAPGDVPHAPTVHEGIAYVVDTVSSAGTFLGRVWQANLRTLQVVRSNSLGGNAFVFGGTGNAIQRISSSPTVGYISILDNSGGMDKVMYLPLAPQGAPNIANAGLMSVWLGAKGEKPSEVTPSPGAVIITTRAATQGGLPLYEGAAVGDPLGIRISLVKGNGVVVPASRMKDIFTGISESQGTVTLTLAPMMTWPPDPLANPDLADLDNNSIRIDYTIDWGAAFPASIGSVERGRLQFPTPSIAQRGIVDGIALSPSGTIYVTSSTQRVGPPYGPAINSFTNDHLGSFFALREEGRGIFRMVYRWDLYPQHTFNYSGGSQVVPPVLPDNDPVQYLTFGPLSVSTFIGGNFRAASFQGAPVVRNGEVYVTVSGQKVQSPASALLCFRDDASAREIRLGRDISSQAAIVQPDFARSADPTQPTTFSVLPPASFRIEKEPGDVGSTIRIDNMMNTQRGQIIDSISASQPIILRESGRPDTIIDPAQQNDRWNPLKWYSIFHGMTIRSSAYCSGNTVFVSGSSVVPSLLDFNFPPTQEGYVTALRTDFDPSVAQKTSQLHLPYSANPIDFTPANVVADDARPYMRQVISMDYIRTGPGWTSTQSSFDNMYPNQLSVWPQVPQNKEERGRTSFEDFRIRINQCTLRGGTNLAARDSSFGVVGGDGILMAWNNFNIFAFKRSNTWVADEGRISMFDPSGNVVFDSSLQTVSGSSTAGFNSAANLTKFSRPTRVYPLNDTGDVLVVDSDQNRVLKMNPNGQVGRSLTEFKLDAAYVPAGYKSSDPLTFANPRDATTYVSEVALANNRFSNARPLEYWVHYMIADQGNNRLVEIVDRYEESATTGQIIGVIAEGSLLWHSPPAVSNKGYAYNSVTRLQTGLNKFIIVAGVGGKAPTRLDSGEPQTGSTVIGDQNPIDGRTSNTGNGGIVIFDGSLAGGYRVFNQFNAPAVDHTRVWDPTTVNWSTNTAANIPARTRLINNLQSVTASLIPPLTVGAPPQLALMITDATGIYEVMANSTDPTVLDTRWMLPTWAFKTTRRLGGVPSLSSNPMGFLPTYARRLDSDNVILVNGYSGKMLDLSTNYAGEVLQVDGRIDPVAGLQAPTYVSQGFSINTVNLGFNTRSIKLRLGPVEGSRGLVLPVFADRR